MATSLYDLSVASYLQTLGAISGVLERGAKHFAEVGVDPESVVETRLFDDMLPFRFQIISVAHHSLGAVEGLKTGVFGPPNMSQALDYKGLQGLVADSIAGLEAMTPGEVNALEGRDMVFQMGETRLPFTVESFVLSFSLPNFHFHATTTYDILRMKGVPLGKRHYLGRMHFKT